MEAVLGEMDLVTQIQNLGLWNNSDDTLNCGLKILYYLFSFTSKQLK